MLEDIPDLIRLLIVRLMPKAEAMPRSGSGLGTEAKLQALSKPQP